jgi:poly-gamma-glutamate synthesis protein (capsule biosynthesis protein)
MKRVMQIALALALASALNGTFAAGQPVRADEPVPGVVHLMAVGDLEMAFGVGRRIVNVGPQVPFAQVADYFATADLVVANLECSLSRNGAPWPRKQLHFGAPAQAADALAVGGVDVVSVANNHSLDFGPQAFLDTLARLDGAGVGHFGGGADQAGAHTPLILERNDLRIAFLSYVTAFWGPYHFNTRAWEATPTKWGIAIARADEIAADVTAARAVADVVVVSLHADGEYHHMPRRSMRRMADAAVGAGAALVLGSGPHVLQGYRAGDHTLIAYSLGNFVFPGYTGRAKDSAILDVTLTADGVTDFDWIPIVIRKALPQPATGPDAERVLDQIRPI